MSSRISQAAVIGAGTMGAGIAAHIANAGLPVLLLDVPEPGDRRNRRAEDAIKRQLTTGGFMHPICAERVTAGNIEDDLPRLAEADWIVEAVAERLDVKRDLFSRIEAVRSQGSIVSSNTSTLPLAEITNGQQAAFARDFLVTHFFNPPRQMRLLELVAGPDTRAEAVEAIREFADVGLGKGVVACNDRPGFIANRIGCFWLAAGLAEAMTLGLSVEEADAVIGRPFGIPPTGIFGLFDLVGLDLMPSIWASLARNLPTTDGLHRYDLDPPLIHNMVGRGLLGRKAGAGFRRMVRDGDARIREALDLSIGEYRAPHLVSLESLATGGRDLRALLAHEDRGGRYAWRVMGATLAYAASAIPEVADDPAALDEAMRLGYAWSRGPFELIDAIGPAWFADRLKAQGQAVPPLLAAAAELGSFHRDTANAREVLGPDGGYLPLRRPPGTLRLADLGRQAKPVLSSSSGALWDLGDGVACLEFRTKANAFDTALLTLVEQATAAAGRGFRALLLGNDAASFSAGADLRGLLDAARQADWAWIEAMILTGQRAFAGLRNAPFPVVAAVAGNALGGGCEAALHSDSIQAHADVQMGLVEARVGLVPGWGGCRELLLRRLAIGDAPEEAARRAFASLLAAQTSTSALEAREIGFLRARDGITMNRERLLFDAKQVALRLAPGYRPSGPEMVTVTGAAGRKVLLGEPSLAARLATPHDCAVAEALATILTGGGAEPVQALPADEFARLEREAFLALIRRPEALTRIQDTVGAGRPQGA